MNQFSIFIVKNQFLGVFLVIMVLISCGIFGFDVSKICTHFKHDKSLIIIPDNIVSYNSHNNDDNLLFWDKEDLANLKE